MDVPVASLVLSSFRPSLSSRLLSLFSFKEPFDRTLLSALPVPGCVSLKTNLTQVYTIGWVKKCVRIRLSQYMNLNIPDNMRYFSVPAL